MSKKLENWLKAAGIRALKTFGQSMASMITIGEIMKVTDWEYAIKCSIVACVYSLCTSLAGLPELKLKENK